jgi:hypothetical protein
MYSLFGVGLQLARGEDDEFNTLSIYLPEALYSKPVAVAAVSI